MIGLRRILRIVARGWKTRSSFGFGVWLTDALRRRLASSARYALERWWPTRRPILARRVAALGPNSRAIFKGARGVSHRFRRDEVDIIIADQEIADAEQFQVPIVSLAKSPSLSVPAFDPRLDNPVGWPRKFTRGPPVALGHPRLLPNAFKARKAVRLGNRARLSQSHHVVDTAAFHRDAIKRAGMLVRLAATGVPIRLVDRDPQLAALLGAELHDLLTANICGADARTRELHSIKIRRVALRDHTFRARLRQTCAEGQIRGDDEPAVSILLATRRPHLLPWAVDNVARQNYPRLQLAVALHGSGFDEGDVENALSRLSIPTRVTRVAEHIPYGGVLAAATLEATGCLLATLDDDDVYGPDHIWDLVLAREYAQSELVGKGAETIYLAGSDQTVCRELGSGESYSAGVAGAALMIGREDLERVGGWQVARFADRTLHDDVIRAGGRVYRTHGAGFMVIRHVDRHAWPADEEYFVGSAASVCRGWHPCLAGLDGVARPLHSYGTNRA